MCELRIVLACAAVSLLGAAGGTGSGRVTFNEAALSSHEGEALSEVLRQPVGHEVQFSDPRSVLKYVLANAPPRAIVYPTEQYYYYSFPLGSRLVSGNIRFVDAVDGGISIGYFDAYNESDLIVGTFQSGQDGLELSYAADHCEIRVRIDNIERVFVLDDEAFGSPSIELLEDEQFISGIRDESGYFLYLMYWKPQRSFYYVLNPSKQLPERWSRGESDTVELWFGDQSRFCFYHHRATDRFILVGVHERHIRENTMYDGPFDQVPPRLPIRAIVEEAYPYVIAAGGIDAHGNFVRTEGSRVAISPYRAYRSGPELVVELETVVRDSNKPDAWLGATYEYKRDWRPPRYYTERSGHETSVSRSWPANHWGTSSRAWGTHEVGASAAWPPNHVLGTSGSNGSPSESHDVPQD